MMNQPVPDGSTTLAPRTPFQPKSANGQVWFFDYSRTMRCPDLHGNTAFVLFVEKNTLFVVVALIKSHSDIWDHAQALVDWTWTHLGVRVSHLCGDSDPEWTNSQPHSQQTKTTRARAFETKNGLTILVSPPYAHAFNLSEGRMKPITSIMAMQLQYAYLSDIMWGFAVVTAADIHNSGPIVDSSRPALQDTVPSTALLGKRVDVRSLGAALGCTAWVKVPGSKASDLSRNARLGIFLGMAFDTIGWRILILEDRSEIVSHHVLIDHDISNRPVQLAQHDRSLLLGSHLSAGPTLFNRAIRDLMIPATMDSTTPRGFIMYSKLTHQPIAFTLAYDDDDHPDLIELTSVTPQSHLPPGSQRTSARPARRTRLLRGTGPLQTIDDALPIGSSPPSLPLASSARQRLRLIISHRRDTPIRIAIDNPKKSLSKSAHRYDSTKHTTTIGDYFKAGGKMADFLNDYTRSYIEMGSLASLRCLDPTLALTFLGPSNMGLLQPPPNDPTTTPPWFTNLRLEPPQTHAYGLYLASCEPCVPYSTAPPDETPAAHLHAILSSPTLEPPTPPVAAPSLSAVAPAFSPLPTATPMCTFFPFCKRGDRCKFLHDTPPAPPHQLPPAPPADAPTGPAPPPPSTASIRNTVLSVLESLPSSTTGPTPINLTELIDSITANIAPKLQSLDHHDNNTDAFLDSILSAVATTDLSPDLTSDPTTYKDFLKHPQREAFRKVMLDELLQLFDTFHTFSPVPLSDVRAHQRTHPNTRVIPTKWVWVTKHLASGEFNRHKARLVACEAVNRFNVENKWSPTIAMDSARLIFVIAAINQCELLSLDVSGAYLRGRRRASSDPVYLRLPPGLDSLRDATGDTRLSYKTNSGEPLFWRCDANLYGLQDAGAIWWVLARDWLLGLGFKQSTVDPCVFSLWRSEGDFCVIGLYVDDSLGAYSTTSIKEWYLAEFEKYFQQSPDSGSDHPEFIAIRFTVSPDRRTVRLNTPKLWGRLRARFGDVDLPNVSSPLPHNAIDLLYADISPENPIVSKLDFDSFGTLGVANWGVLACRPAESFAGALLARRAHVPTLNFVKCVTHYCAYLLAHEHDELTYTATAQLINDLRSLVDSSWGNCPETHRSWFGYCITWCGAVFSWRAKLQPCVALASRDSEAIAAVFAVKAILGFLIMLSELGFHSHLPATLHVDNMATVAGAHSEKISKESRFMAMRLKWLRKMVRSNLVGIRHVATGDNHADIFTKNLPAHQHAIFRAVLMGTATATVAYGLFGT
jgi:hypothetical protein